MRYPEVDLARFMAMFAMALYHTAFDLKEFYGWNIDLDRAEWVMMQKGTLFLFLMLVGVSGVLMRQSIINRTGEHVLAATDIYKKIARRALTIFFWAMVITLVTYAIDPATAIFFGVLHCIGISLMLLPLFLPLGLWNVPIGIAVILLGLRFPFPPPFITLDYVPLLPNFGMILLGATLGHLLYERGMRPKTWEAPSWLRSISLPGRHALVFYLAHQPVIILILAILFGLPKF